jgi:hypothetical protein
MMAAENTPSPDSAEAEATAVKRRFNQGNRRDKAPLAPYLISAAFPARSKLRLIHSDAGGIARFGLRISPTPDSTL